MEKGIRCGGKINIPRIKKIPKELYVIVQVHPILKQYESGFRKYLTVVARPDVDFSDIYQEEELGWEDELTKEQIEEVKERLEKKARELAWNKILELIKAIS